jgi:hypothetical protein
MSSSPSPHDWLEQWELREADLSVPSTLVCCHCVTDANLWSSVEPASFRGVCDFCDTTTACVTFRDLATIVVDVLGRRLRVQTASLVLCHSRMRYVQMYPRFTRFECKLFLTDAIRYFDGSCERCMIDNTHVVVLSGTGRDMVPSPEMAAFAERFGFEFLEMGSHRFLQHRAATRVEQATLLLPRSHGSRFGCGATRHPAPRSQRSALACPGHHRWAPPR